MVKYRKKPVVIEAVQFVIDPETRKPKLVPEGMHLWSDEDAQPRDMSWGYIDTLEGRHHVLANDWIITGVKGEKYPCKPDIFEMTYTPAVRPDHGMRIPMDHAIITLGKDNEGEVIFATDVLKEMIEVMQLEEKAGTLKEGWAYHFKKIEVRKMPTTPGK